MTERLRIYRAEAGPKGSPKGVLFGRDDRARQKYVVVDRQVVFDVLLQMSETQAPIEYWTRDAQRLLPGLSYVHDDPEP